MKKDNVFNLADIQNEYNLIGKTSEFILPSGKTVIYKKYFSQSEINELIEEFKTDYIYSQKNNLELLNSTEDIIKYQGYLIIKNFTHLKEEIGNDFHKKMAVYNKLIEIGLYNTILEEILPESEVKKAIDGTLGYLVNVGKFAEASVNLRDVKSDGI